MDQDGTRNRRRMRLYLAKRISLWTLFIATLLGLGLKFEFDHLQQQFQQRVDQGVRHSERSAKTFDVALDGFRQFLGLLPNANLDAARNYAATLRQHYPELRVFAIAQSLDSAGRLADVVQLEQLGYSGLRLIRLTADGEMPASASEQAYRLPMVFTEPPLNSAERLLQIDLAFNQALRQRDPLRTKQAGPAFDQLDGEIGYLLFAPVALNPAAAELDAPWQNAYALLLVYLRDLLPDTLLNQPGWSLRLQSQPSETQPGRVLWQHGASPSAVLAGLPGHFAATRVLGSDSQPFILQFDYGLRWQDLDHQYLGLLLALVLALVIVAKRAVLSGYRRSLGEIAAHSSLYQQANYDHLTGLPNANLLMDRMERAVATLDPHNERLLLAYLDLDHFKPVNDRWGHEAGDRLLVEVARRLRQQFRMQDTVSRIHGDEFIVLLSVPLARAESAAVADKVRAAFASPFEINGVSVELGCSLGITVYPDDAEDGEQLISVADRRMYQNKRRRYQGTPLSI